MKTHLLAAGLTAVLFSSAVAAEEFNVVKNLKTAECKVSNKKGDGKYVTIGTSSYQTAGNGEFVIIGTSSYQSAEDATKAMNAAPECNERNKE